MKDQRTPGTWYVGGIDKDTGSIEIMAPCIASQGYYVADVIGGLEEQAANAAFIVRACNAHDDLVATAKVALEQYRLYLYVNGLPEDGRAFDALDAAITKATA